MNTECGRLCHLVSLPQSTQASPPQDRQHERLGRVDLRHAKVSSATSQDLSVLGQAGLQGPLCHPLPLHRHSLDERA
eukprot:scaffold319279_cov22-Prasinocladus_malaysianus.AAC.1